MEGSWDLFTETAKIVIPAKLKFRGEYLKLNNDLFKRGDKVTVKLGYYPELITVFEGYINKVIPDYQFTLECENEMWKLKQTKKTQTWDQKSLEYIVKDISTIPYNIVGDLKTSGLGKLSVSNVNVVQVLEKLKDYGFYSYIKNKTLMVGLAYDPANTTIHNISFQRNVISSDLEYRNSDTTPVGVKAISMLSNNKKIETFVGDASGDQITLHYFGLNEKDLKETAARQLPKYQYTGYYGTFTTFGKPYIQHGDFVSLTDERFPGRDGQYVVKSVSRSFGMDGYRQKVELSFKITA